ncbi:RagB/SusD family nutrient uptake outer membrane protein [Mangrovibacterium sp.]|uniref:RagB/SusD family nutrient uptake outer membrane protein n=1 Tax=Mangrovibacterium sp. TaxID=1961364 RepID=UPI0035613AF7
MKKNKFHILILMFLVSLFGCDDFLDKAPEDTLSPTVYYNNVTELKTGLAGCYKVLQSIYAHDGMMQFIEMASDDAKDRQMTDRYHIFKKTNAQSAASIWTENYLLIYRCNTLLEVLTTFGANNDDDAEEVNAMIGECYFLRALAYMNLVRTYGPVPKVTAKFGSPSEAFGIGRASVAEIYNEVIIPDFENAFDMCFKKGATQLNGEEARATKGSALMGLAKAQMEMNDYGAAESTLKKLIVDKAAGTYALMPSLTDVFSDTKKFNVESIFEVNYNVAAGQPSWFFRMMTNDIAYTIGTTYLGGSYMVSHDLLQEFTEYGDFERLNLTVDSGYVAGATPEYQAFPIKMAPDRAGMVAQKNVGTDYNFMVYRYADALLMYAECLMNNNKKDEAIGYVSDVRERSNMPRLAADFDLDIYAILHERRMELAFEGHRFFDLKRTGKAIEIISEALMTVTGEDYAVQNEPIEEYQLLFPIPVSEIEKDQTLAQNSGY